MNSPAMVDSPNSPIASLFNHLRKFVKGSKWHVVLGSELFLLDTEVPLSIEPVGNMVVVSGTGVLESSTNLADWIEVGAVEGLMSIPRDSTGPAKFYRLKR
jgi:hypothetical protein